MKIFKNSTDPESLGNYFRKRRFEFIKFNLFKLLKEKSLINSNENSFLTILDVGGLEEYWINMSLNDNLKFKITLLNLNKQKTISSNIISVAGDATNLKEYGVNEFDLVFSNSVIEHLYTLQNQMLMCSEVMRVGLYYFIQTPNKYFFMEPHYLIPYFQYLPKGFRFFILTSTKLSRGIKWNRSEAAQYLDEIRLLSLKELLFLFPNCKIYKEKFLGLNKSFSAHNFN